MAWNEIVCFIFLFCCAVFFGCWSWGCGASNVDFKGFVVWCQVMLTPTHLAIVMEYAAGGELFERICNAGRFSEDEVSCVFSFAGASVWCAWSHLWSFFVHFCGNFNSPDRSWFFALQARFFFQQLISGVSYCHSMVLLLILFFDLHEVFLAT